MWQDSDPSPAQGTGHFVSWSLVPVPLGHQEFGLDNCLGFAITLTPQPSPPPPPPPTLDLCHLAGELRVFRRPKSLLNSGHSWRFGDLSGLPGRKAVLSPWVTWSHLLRAFGVSADWGLALQVPV